MKSNTALAWQDINDEFNDVDDKERIEGVLVGAIARQRETHGEDLRKPCPEAQELLDHLSEETGQDCTQWRRGMVARVTSDAELRVVASADRCDNAEVLGEDCAEWKTLLEQEITLTFGKLYTSAKEMFKSTRRDAWHGKTMTVAQFIEGQEGNNAVFQSNRRETWGLWHTSQVAKEGIGYVFGNCLGTRTAQSVQYTCPLWIDHDSGHVSFDQFVSNASELGFAFVAYETHSNGTMRTFLKRADVVKHAKCKGDPTREQVQAFAYDKKVYADHIVVSIEIEQQRCATENGEMIVNSPAPISEFRAIFFLAEGDVPLAGPDSIANTQEIVKAKLRGLANMVQTPTDPGAVYVSRFLYAARHSKSAKQRVVIHRGPAIAFAGVPELSQTKPDKGKWQRREDVVADDGTNVTELYNRYGKRWMLADVAARRERHVISPALSTLRGKDGVLTRYARFFTLSVIRCKRSRPDGRRRQTRTSIHGESVRPETRRSGCS